MQHEKIATNSGAQLTSDSDYQGLKVACEFCFVEKVYQKSSRIEARPRTEQKYLNKMYRS